MIQICYTSRATAPLDHRTHATLVTQAQANNGRDDVTGLLLYDGMRFIQALEGPRIVTEACMARIRGDTRHEAIDVISQCPIAARQFGTFAMAAMMPGEMDQAAFVETVKSHVSQVSTASVRAVFIGFAVLGRSRRAAAAMARAAPAPLPLTI